MRSRPTALLATLLGAGVFLMSAQSAGASGLELVLRLTAHQPSAPTGAVLHLVYPDNGPGGKPKPVSKGVYRFPTGTAIDEAATPACLASDAELELLGNAACPPESALGGGGITVDTGFGPPIDPLALDDSYFHGPGQLITVFRPHEAPGPVLQVNRLQVHEAEIIDHPSLPPGYPPGTKTVAKEVNQEIALAQSPAGAFMTSPPACPKSRRWISHLTITYEDGSIETATSATPCTP